MKRGKIRHIIQACFAGLSNGYLKGFATGKIYTGNGKILCSPGINCYSCPGAVASCPIGSLQAVLGSRGFKISLYVVGIMFVIGGLLGRGVCAFLCPFGFLQDMLYKIPLPKRKKIRKLPGEKLLRKLKYIILVFLVILLPMTLKDDAGLGTPWFCKLLCPVGTLEGGIPLAIINHGIREAVGFLFEWKVLILAVIIVGAVFVYRPFCRYFCPLGAIYGFFNRYSVYRIGIDSTKCIKCGRCQNVCKFDIKVWENPNSIDCIRCGECIDVCPRGCLSVPEVHKEKTSD